MADIFDDDEENPPIGFEQDPDEDEIGIGTWKYADGSSRYSKGDAEDAKKLMAQPATAEAPSLDEQFLGSTTGAEAEDQAEASESPKALGGVSPEPAQPPAPEGPRGQPLPPKAPLQAPQLPGARGPARYTDTTGSSASEGQTSNAQSSTSVTRSAQDEGQFKEQQGNIAQSYAGQKQAQDEGSAGVVGAIQERRGQLMQLAQDREAATVAAQAQRDARANQVKQKIGEVSARKTDHNKIWKDKGAFGTTLGLLGVALRSLTATKFGGPNTALQSIQEQKKQNLQAQMEDRDSELRGLEKELGSLDAAVPMLEARMNDALGKRLEAMTLNEKSAQVLANAKAMKAQLDTERDQKLAEAAKAYYGTVAQQQSAGLQQSSQQSVESGRSRLSGAGVGGEGKGGDPLEESKKWLERDKMLEERGMAPDSPERKYAKQMAGIRSEVGESAPARTNREQEEKIARDEESMNEDQSKAESGMALLNQWGNDAGLTRDPKTGKWVEPGGFGGTVKPGWDEGVRGLAGQSTPATDSRRAAVQGVGRFLSGSVIGEEEGKEFEGLIGDESASRNQIASRLNRMETLVNERRKAKFKKTPRSAPASWKKAPAEATE